MAKQWIPLRVLSVIKLCHAKGKYMKQHIFLGLKSLHLVKSG